MGASGKDEAIETISDINRKNIIELRKNNGKGVTATVSTVLLMSITVAAAGSLYITTDNIMEESSQEAELTTSAPITVESCWANQSGTYIMVRNDQTLYELNTNSVTAYIKGESRETEINKETVRPQNTFRLKFDEVLEDGVTPRIEAQDYFSEYSCGVLIDPLDANFYYSPDPPQETETVTFEDSSEGLIDSYKWYVDGSFEGQGKVITHAFSSKGLHEVKLQIEDIRGDTKSVIKDVNVIDDEIPYFRFLSISDNSPVTAGDSFKIDYSLENPGGDDQQPVRLEIEGKGIRDTNTHSIDEGQSASGTLEWQTSSGDGGTFSYEVRSRNETESGTVNVIDPSSLDADFQASNYNPVEGEEVSFTDQSSMAGGSISSWNWDFEDGSTSSDRNPDHKFNSPGTYSVNLTVEAYGNTDSVIKDINVESSTNSGGTTDSLTADFDYSPTTPMPGETADLDASPSYDPDGTITSYEWDTVDDGIWNKNGITTQKSFGNEGTFPVTLKITSTTGDTGTVTKQIVVGLNYIKEKGGSGNAEIGTLTVTDTAEIRGPTTATGSNICLGTNCPDNSGSETSLDTDQYVNESGDRMDGTLYTDGFSSGGDICVGTDCSEPLTTDGPALSTGNQDTQSDFRLEVPAIKPNTDNNVCLGTDC